MKLKKERMDGDGVPWTPVKLSRRERLQVYRVLAATPADQDFPGELKRIPPQQIEMIVKEFRPGEPKRWDGANEVSPIKTGIHGNEHFCEAGCGAVIATKTDKQVFSRTETRRPFYVCEVCKARLDREKAEYERSQGGGASALPPDGNDGLAALAKAVHEAMKDGTAGVVVRPRRD